MPWRWLREDVVVALHEQQIAEHGGATGIRDKGLLQSALARPKNLLAYGKPDVEALAAAYAFGICRNHPFVDGNKRAAFVALELFLNLNGHELVASDVDCVTLFIDLADGRVSEEELAIWVRNNLESGA